MKIFYFTVLAAMLLACTRMPVEEEPNAMKGEEYCFTAYLNDVDTKSVRQSDGSVYWSPGDAISLFFRSGTNGGSKFTAQNTEAVPIAQFKGTIDVISGGGESAGGEFWFWGIYPYSTENSCDGSTISTVIPHIQVGKAGTFADNTFITMARSKGLELAFYNICSGIKFSLTRDDIQAVKFSGNNGENVAGQVKVGWDDAGKPAVQEYLNGKTEITVTAPENGTFEVGEEYYIVLPPALFSDGFTLSLITSDYKKGAFVYENSRQFKRSIFVNISNLDERVTEWGDDTEYQLAVEREALIAIYNSTGGDKWINKTNWCSVNDVGTWSGVNTDENGLVVGLQLYEVQGPIPSDLFLLSNLRELIISSYVGDYTNVIPSGINRLSNLEELSLHGRFKGTIPKEIGSLQKLKYLELSDAGLSGAIPSEIGQLTQLEYLDLQMNQLSGELPESMGNLRKLRHVILRSNQLSGNIPMSIQNLPIWKYDWGRIISGNYFNEHTLSIPAPTIDGVTMDGVNVQYDDNTPGYFVLIQWSAQYDAYLYAQINALNQMNSKYDGQVDFMGLLSSSREVDINSVESYVASNGITWPSIFWTAESEVIVGQELAIGTSRHEYAAPCFPAIFVFHEGKVVYWDLDVYGGVSGLDDYLSINVLGEQPDYYISTDYSLDGVYTKAKSATKGNGINIVLMGDAYSDRQISGGDYTSNLDRIVDAFFSEEPYRSFEDYFNVYYVNVVSAVEGYEHDGQTLKTFFGSGSFVGGDNTKCIGYAKKCIKENDLDNALIIVSMNSDRYAGTCHMFSDSVAGGDYGEGLSIAYFPMGSLDGIVCHEAGGHGFAKLADEYAYEYMGAVPQSEIDAAQSMAAYGWWKNVDFIGDPAQVKWAQFISDSRYAAENIGCYEGAYTYWTGAWRPTEESIMNHNTGGFNAPSRYAIWYRIGKLAYGDSWNGTYEDFVAYDAVNRTSAATAVRRQKRNYVEKQRPPLAPPVVIGHSWREAKKSLANHFEVQL